MTEQELLDLIAADEADRVEFTVSTTDTDKFSEAVCAFANDLPNHGKPGYLIIGVDGKGGFHLLDRHNKTLTAVSDELLLKLGGLRDDGNIQPLPSITVEKVVTGQGDVAVVKVFPSLLPPVRYRGRICIRIGPRRGYASELDERILFEKRISRARTFDAEPCLGSGLGESLDIIARAGCSNRCPAHSILGCREPSPRKDGRGLSAGGGA